MRHSTKHVISCRGRFTRASGLELDMMNLGAPRPRFAKVGSYDLRPQLSGLIFCFLIRRN